VDEVKVLMPDEVEKQNIITATELRITVEALDVYIRLYASRRKLTIAESAKRKIKRTLAEMWK
jgi:hypothetical protein